VKFSNSPGKESLGGYLRVYGRGDAMVVADESEPAQGEPLYAKLVEQGRVVYREGFPEQAARAERTWGTYKAAGEFAEGGGDDAAVRGDASPRGGRGERAAGPGLVSPAVWRCYVRFIVALHHTPTFSRAPPTRCNESLLPSWAALVEELVFTVRARVPGGIAPGARPWPTA
jgi:hypothetical protein